MTVRFKVENDSIFPKPDLFAQLEPAMYYSDSTYFPYQLIKINRYNPSEHLYKNFNQTSYFKMNMVTGETEPYSNIGFDFYDKTKVKFSVDGRYLYYNSGYYFIVFDRQKKIYTKRFDDYDNSVAIGQVIKDEESG